MSAPQRRHRPPRVLSLGLTIGALMFLFWHIGHREGIASASKKPLPEFRLIEGAAHSLHPYSPQVLVIPAAHPVSVALTDYLGGCGLVTVFPRLGPHGTTARVAVPIGATRMIELYAPRPGNYPYHCAGHMYFGLIKAR